jgi:tetratricopeptide (TPR) repeat protein
MEIGRRTVLQGLAAAAVGPPLVQAAAAMAKPSAAAARRKILIKGGHVATVDKSVGELAGGDVLIDGTTIAAIGKDLAALDAEIVDDRGKLVLPGLIDTHRHTWETVTRSLISEGNARGARSVSGVGRRRPCKAAVRQSRKARPCIGGSRASPAARPAFERSRNLLSYLPIGESLEHVGANNREVVEVVQSRCSAIAEDMMIRHLTTTLGRTVIASHHVDAALAIALRAPRVTRRIRRIGLGVFAALAIVGAAREAPAVEAGAAGGERFEISSIKAVRPTLVNTVAALQQRDAARAKAAFDAYDSAWNGIEVYINVRSKSLYDDLEHNYQARIAKALDDPNPDTAAVLTDAQAMLARYDEAIGLVAKAAPLNPLFDDVARLRIVRAHLREVLPALKAGNVAKARKSFMDFDDTWDSIEDLVKARSADAYVAIEKGMIEIEQALMPDKPDAARVTALVNDVLARYNAALAEVVKEARGRP